MADVFAGLPANDEDVVRVSMGDFATLAPKCLHLVEASDGAIGAGSWALTSATTDFTALGIQPGHVVILQSRSNGVDGQGRPKTASMSNSPYGITSVSGTTCNLHPLGYATAIGRPPGFGTAISGVTFSIASVIGVIADESVEVRTMLGLADTVDLSTLVRIRKLAAMKTLRSLYFQEYRQTQQDTWKDKMDKMDVQIALVLKSLYDLFPTSDPSGLEPTVGVIEFECEPPCRPCFDPYRC